jgi:acyl carrier protein
MARASLAGKKPPQYRRNGLPSARPDGIRAATPTCRDAMMSDTLQDQIYGLIEPFNKKGVALTNASTFAGDLEWDSLTVMDFVAEVEDAFDIIISMNLQAEIETVGQLIDAVERLKA